ncbi:MFS transporter [Pseudonocardia sp. KRD-169]|uniref:MFS transporter n=1 Tax=Pseudonocardia abyssalis TaxID=2792008 RepID=A0ABS6UVK8_9PSEU|nr:MFS transporter [Pseudonocardia abyssalis]MBW0136217.1 MFS transporter [Pseudonocardia abyssalis]
MSPLRLTLLAGGAFAVGTSAYVVAGLLPQISAELGVSISAAGQLTTAFALAYALGAPLLATLLGRRDRRGVLVAALLIAALGNLLSALAPSYGLLMVGRVLTALGAAAFTPAATHAATLLSPPERRGRAVSAVFTGITLSLVVGVPAGTLIGGIVGYRGVFAVVAALCLAGALGVRALLPTVDAPAPVGLRERLAVAADRRVLTILGITVLGLMAVLTVYTYIAPLLAESAGVTGPLLGALLVVYGIGALIGNDLGGRLTDRFGSRRPLLMTLPVITLALVTLPFTITSVVGAGIAMFVLGGGFVVNAPVQTRLIELAPSGSALVLSLNASAIYLGIGLAGLVGGGVVAVFGVLALPLVGAVLSLGSLGLLVLALRQEPAPGSVAA